MLLAALALANTLHAGTPTGTKTETPVVTPSTHSFLEPVGDFVNDSIIRPTAPFELVPGKNPNDWGFVIEPYLWAMGISGTTGVGGLPALNVHSSARNLIQSLDWGIMGRGEIRKGRWGILGDGYYAALSGSADLGGVLYKDASVQIQQGLASLSLAYRIIDDRRGFLDIYAGARYNYIGIQTDLTQDAGGIGSLGQDITNGVASKVSAQVESMVAAFRTQAESAFADAVENELSSALLSRHSKSRASLDNLVLLERVADPLSRRDRGIGSERRQGDRRGGRDRLVSDRRLGPERARELEIRSSLDQHRLRDVLASARGDIRAYIRAEAAARLAAANGTLTSDVQARADTAKSKMAKSISNALEQSLPTHFAGDQWWIDPIVGLRGQINLTRWLFLAAQGDVGGFGVGSQITWNTQATIGVNFTRNIFAELGYRYMYVDYNKNNFLYQMNSYGLFSSIGVKF